MSRRVCGREGPASSKKNALDVKGCLHSGHAAKLICHFLKDFFSVCMGVLSL